MIYLDNAATTPLCEEAAKEQVFWACSNFYNPSATYIEAVKVSQALKEARERLKAIFGAKEGDIIFTSGATEANNLAVRGSCREGKAEYVFSSVEHASVNNLATQLLNEGKEITLLTTSSLGENYDNVMLKAEVTSKPENSNLKLTAVNELSQEVDILQDGWGSTTGYALGGKDVNHELKMTANFDMIGEYKIKFSILDKDTSDKLIVEKEFTIK